MAVKNFYRFNDMNLLAVTEFFISSLAHNRVHVDRIDSLALGMPIENSSDGSEHMMHGLTKILTTMGSDDNMPAISKTCTTLIPCGFSYSKKPQNELISLKNQIVFTNELLVSTLSLYFIQYRLK